MRLIDIEPFETEKGAESCRITRWFVGDGYSTQVVTHTRDIPTIDPESLRPKGEWTECDWVEYDGHGECIHYPKEALRCSNCCNAFKKKLLWKRNFCPNCGADMRGTPHDS